jgi:hypothetical protein
MASGECDPHEREVAQARATAPDGESFAAAWTQGREMTLEQVAEYALCNDEGKPPATP